MAVSNPLWHDLLPVRGDRHDSAPNWLRPSSWSVRRRSLPRRGRADGRGRSSAGLRRSPLAAGDDAGPEKRDRSSGPRCATDAGARSMGTASRGNADRLGKERVGFSVTASSVNGAALIRLCELVAARQQRRTYAVRMTNLILAVPIAAVVLAGCGSSNASKSASSAATQARQQRLPRRRQRRRARRSSHQ